MVAEREKPHATHSTWQQAANELVRPDPARLEVLTGDEVMRPGRLGRLLFRLADWRMDAGDGVARAIRHERETGGLFNLLVVSFALGILVYFATPAEPIGFVLVASTAIAGFMAWRMERHGIGHAALVALSMFLAGMSAAKFRVDWRFAPVLEREMTATVKGTIIAVDRSSRGAPRYLIRPEAVEGLDVGALPARLRLSTSSRKVHFVEGDAFAGKARLMPFSGPAYPGGYDFGFFARFDRIGGTGFFYGAPKAAKGGEPLTLADRSAVALNRFRQAMARRIHAVLPGERGDVAVALVTGDRSGIDEATAESLRRSGLAHVLAISGLHMALVTLTVIGSLRWVAAWFPALVLRYPVRKWAAGAGLVAATAYLIISGASVATQRAWIMIAVMLLAMLADRRAVTIRNVVIAAFVILAMSPESLLEPGFQMSFAAAASLVAAYEAWTRYRGRRPRERTGQGSGSGIYARRIFVHLGAYFGAIVFTSLVAGLATGIFAAWHFHRIAPLGLLANVAAIPIVTLIVMPAALISALAMPYGLEQWPLTVFGWGIDRMVAISDWVNGFGVPATTGLQPLGFLLAGSAGLALLTLMRSRLRLLGLAPLALLPVLAGSGPVPDVLVAQDGRAIAISDNEGRLALAYPRSNRFITDIWLAAWSGGEAGDRKDFEPECGRDFCAANLNSGLRLEIVYAPKLLGRACRSADILLAPRLRWVDCDRYARQDGLDPDKVRRPLLIVKRGDLESRGSHAVWVERGQSAASDDPATAKTKEIDAPIIRVETALRNGTRPWSARPLTPDQ